MYFFQIFNIWMLRMEVICFLFLLKSTFSHKDLEAHHRVGFSYYVDNDSNYVSVSNDVGLVRAKILNHLYFRLSI